MWPNIPTKIGLINDIINSITIFGTFEGLVEVVITGEKSTD